MQLHVFIHFYIQFGTHYGDLKLIFDRDRHVQILLTFTVNSSNKENSKSVMLSSIGI